MTAKQYHVLGVPLRTGSFIPGSENDAKAYRTAGLIDQLQKAGCQAVDEGDVEIPNYLPHHFIPPFRNWPGPRIVWDLLAERLAPILKQPGHVPLMIGCDCSVVIGTTQALQAEAQDVRVLYIDGDVDDAPPDPAHCKSAAAMAVWLLTNPSPFWTGPTLQPSQVTVVGCSQPSVSRLPGMRTVSLDDVRITGAAESARRILAEIPASSSILVHLDIDVLRDRDLPAAYFPHTDGLGLSDVQDLLRVVLLDSRIRLVEVTEYSMLRDLDGHSVSTLIAMLVQALGT